MQTIKIIDLLNRNEKPKKIKYKNYIWILDENDLYDNKDIAIDLDVYISSVQVCDLGRNLIDVLNDEVEIPDDPNKIDEWGETPLKELEKSLSLKQLQTFVRVCINTQQELIKAVNYLLEKSNTSE